MKIGVLAYQGGIDEHRFMVKQACEEMNINCGVEHIAKKYQLDDIDALIFPGGESTTILKLARRSGVAEIIQEKILQGLPVLATCAGTIILAKKVKDLKTGRILQNTLGCLDAVVVRNFYGRQRESFEVDIDIPILGGKPFRAVFIRAPAIVEISHEVKPLAMYNENYVLVQQKNIVAAVFHPELSGDTRIHKYFLELAKR